MSNSWPVGQIQPVVHFYHTHIYTVYTHIYIWPLSDLNFPVWPLVKLTLTLLGYPYLALPTKHNAGVSQHIFCKETVERMGQGIMIMLTIIIIIIIIIKSVLEGCYLASPIPNPANLFNCSVKEPYRSTKSNPYIT